MLQFTILYIIWNIANVYSKCPNWCNRRGTCTNPSLEHDQYCICDIGYTGEDCTQKICPKAFDFQNIVNTSSFRTVKLTTGITTGKLSGTFEIGFGHSKLKFNADANEVDDLNCKTQLLSWKGVSGVSCNRESVDPDSGAGTYKITILNYPVQPYENNIFNHTGNPPLSSFFCNTSSTVVPTGAKATCVFSDLVNQNLPGNFDLIWFHYVKIL
jgi:hypothetical protein